MGNPVGPHAAIGQVHQVEPRCTRRQGEVSDTDKVPVADSAVVLLQRIECTSKQIGIDLTVDTFCSPESEPCSRKSGSNAGNGKIDKKTPRKCQDIEHQRK